MTDLSPAAQAVLDAFFTGDWEDEPLHSNIARALRAVADQVLIRPGFPRDEYNSLMRLLDNQVRAIAAELEALDD